MSRSLEQVIMDEVGRQCSIGAGDCEYDGETGLFSVGADLDISTLARAVYVFAAVNNPANYQSRPMFDA